MLNWIGATFNDLWGPLRLLESYTFLAVVGFSVSALASWALLPKLWGLLPRDQGRAFAVDAEKSLGKPMSAGVIFIPIFIVMAMLTIPVQEKIWLIFPCIVFSMLVGFYDDRSGGVHEYVLALLDMAVSLAAALVLAGWNPVDIWLPFYTDTITIAPWLNIFITSSVIWVAINATNCTDGVDGLSASLSIISFVLLGALLYLVVGNVNLAQYLLVPHNKDGADWALLSFIMVGTLVGYLWHNAAPSNVMMGDSGSRPMGLLLGVLVCVTNNPLFIIIVGTMVLANGFAGLLKVAVARFLKLHMMRNIRFPLHDHVRKNLAWSNSQVLVRFVIIHAVLSLLLLVLVLKVR